MTKNKDSIRKLEHLKLQLSGKELHYQIKSSDSTTTSTLNPLDADIKYLKTDLLKIFILASIALAAQTGLYYAKSMNLISNWP